MPNSVMRSEGEAIVFRWRDRPARVTVQGFTKLGPIVRTEVEGPGLVFRSLQSVRVGRSFLVPGIDIELRIAAVLQGAVKFEFLDGPDGALWTTGEKFAQEKRDRLRPGPRGNLTC